MAQSRILPFVLGVATSVPLSIGATVFAQVNRSDIREPTGSGRTTVCIRAFATDTDGGVATEAMADVYAKLPSKVPGEPEDSCKFEVGPLGGANKATALGILEAVQSLIRNQCGVN